MKFSFKRILAMVLALAMILPFVPELDLSFGLKANAATTTDFSGSTVANLGFTYTDATGSGSPVASWTASGTQVSGTAVGGYDSGGLRKYYYAYETTLTMTNTGSADAALSFNFTVTVNKNDCTVTVDGTAYTANQTNKEFAPKTLKPGESVIIKLAAKQRMGLSLPAANTTAISISELKLTPLGGTTITFGEATNGSYTVTNTAGEAVTVPSTVSASTTDKFTMTATPADGYAFAGWYSNVDGYISVNATYNALFDKDMTVKPIFVPAAGVAFGVGDAKFADLTDALACANVSAIKTVILLKNTTLTGTYTVPAGVTLLIPKDAEQTAPYLGSPITESPPTDMTQWVKPSVFRTLTMAPGAALIVNGTLEVSAKHATIHGGSNVGGSVFGQYGCIDMAEGSTITLNNGAYLYGWGYVIGDGMITANSGSSIFEKMQVTDYCGGTRLSGILGNNKKVFPFSQYYIQNLEVKTELKTGAALSVHAAVYLSDLAGGAAIATTPFLGEGGMFSVQGDTTLTKEYDPATDRVIISAKGTDAATSTVTLGGISMTMNSMNINSSEYVLPINSNFTIQLEDCTATMNQELLLQPGVQISVGENARMINNKAVYVFDIDQWGGFIFDGRRVAPLQYIPSLGGPSTRTISSDTKVDLNGLLIVNAGFYTTAGGAQIISSKHTGRIKFAVAAAAEGTISQISGYTPKTAFGMTVGYDAVYKTQAAVPALLTNGAGTTSTAGAAANDMFVYDTLRDQWMKVTADVVLNYNANGGNNAPGSQTITLSGLRGETEKSLVAIPSTKPIMDNATFLGWALSADGPVVAQPGDVISLGMDATLYAKWKIEKVTITFLNEDGSVFKTVQVEYGKVADPESFPTKAATAQYTYTFAGWDINGDGVADQLPAATANATYKAVFKATTNSYTITFLNEDGSLFKQIQVAYGIIPDPESFPAKDSTAQYTYTFAGWDANGDGVADEVAAVAGNATYTALFTPILQEYTVIWKDGDGSEKTYTAEYGAALVAPFTPSKAADGSYTYEFAGWDLNGDGQVDTLTTVTGNLTLTPVFTATPIHVCTPGEAVVENKTDATCEDDGSYDSVVYCSGCGKELSRKTVTVSALGHTAHETVVENKVDATCGADGSYEEVIKCECGHEISRTPKVIPATGAHIYDEGVVTKEPTYTETGVKTYTCGTCGDTKTEDIPMLEKTVVDTKFTGKSLALEGAVTINLYVTYTVDGVTMNEDFVEANAGVLYWSVEDMPADRDAAILGTETHKADVKYAGVYQGNTEFFAMSHGIPAKCYGDTVYFRTYILVDGEYQYGEVEEYSILAYCENVFKNQNKPKLESALVALLNYGSAAQTYFAKTGETPVLVNAGFETYLENGWITADMLELSAADKVQTPLKGASAEMTVNFAQSGVMGGTSKSLALEGAIATNYYVAVTDHEALANAQSEKAYFWTEAKYNELQAAGIPLSKENASYVVDAQLTYSTRYGYEYFVASEQVPAPEWGNTQYMATVITDANGVDHCSGVITYSPLEYAAYLLNNGVANREDPVCEWLIAYSHRAIIALGR